MLSTVLILMKKLRSDMALPIPYSVFEGSTPEFFEDCKEYARSLAQPAGLRILNDMPGYLITLRRYRPLNRKRKIENVR